MDRQDQESLKLSQRSLILSNKDRGSDATPQDIENIKPLKHDKAKPMKVQDGTPITFRFGPDGQMIFDESLQLLSRRKKIAEDKPTFLEESQKYLDVL